MLGNFTVYNPRFASGGVAGSLVKQKEQMAPEKGRGMFNSARLNFTEYDKELLEPYSLDKLGFVGTPLKSENDSYMAYLEHERRTRPQRILEFQTQQERAQGLKIDLDNIKYGYRNLMNELLHNRALTKEEMDKEVDNWRVKLPYPAWLVMEGMKQVDVEFTGKDFYHRNDEERKADERISRLERSMTGTIGDAIARVRAPAFTREEEAMVAEIGRGERVGTKTQLLLILAKMGVSLAGKSEFTKDALLNEVRKAYERGGGGGIRIEEDEEEEEGGGGAGGAGGGGTRRRRKEGKGK